jgi:hypothetical protein
MANAMLFFGVTSREFRDGFDEDKLYELCGRLKDLDECDGAGEPRWLSAVSERINQYGCSVVIHGANGCEVYGLCLNETEMIAGNWDSAPVSIAGTRRSRLRKLRKAMEAVGWDPEDHPGWVLAVRE